jgi:hypothetical protein
MVDARGEHCRVGDAIRLGTYIFPFVLALFNMLGRLFLDPPDESSSASESLSPLPSVV